MHVPIYYRNMTVGSYYTLYNRKEPQNYRFVRVTRKGFNFLNEETGEVLLKRSIYAKGMGHKDLPTKRPLTIMFCIPDWLTLKETTNGPVLRNY